jgi:sulfur carrier protein
VGRSPTERLIALVVNGEDRTLDGSATVAALVDEIGCGTKGVAVAVNDEVVPRSTWSARALVEGDRVEVLKAAQGG